MSIRRIVQLLNICTVEFLLLLFDKEKGNFVIDIDIP